MTNSTIECPFPCTPGRGYCNSFLIFLANFIGENLTYIWLLRNFNIFSIFNGNLHFLVNFPLMFLARFSIGHIILFLINSYARGSCVLRILIPFSAICVKFVIWLLILFLAFDVLNFYVVKSSIFSFMTFTFVSFRNSFSPQDYKMNIWNF